MDWVGEPGGFGEGVLLESYGSWMVGWVGFSIMKHWLRGGNSNILYVHPYMGKISHFDYNMFQMG